MKVSFFLTRPKVDAETSVYARICYNGFKIKLYTNESIHPKNWSTQQKRVKESKKFKEYPEFNTRLNNIEAQIKNLYRRFLNDNAGTIPSAETFKQLLVQQIKKQELEIAVTSNLLAFFKTFNGQAASRFNHKTGKPISKSTVKTYLTTYKHLSEFSKAKKYDLDFSKINLDFYTEYTDYLLNDAKLCGNSIGKHFKIIKLVLNEATERGVNKNMAYKSKRFAVIMEKSESIYLNEAELKEFQQLDLNKNSRLQKVRDLFLIGCYTGLRYSDYSILKPENINDGFIEVTQTKTGNPVVIPVHPIVNTIIEKYDGKLPASISNQKTNKYLKDIANQVDSLKTYIKQITDKEGKPILKFNLLTTHTARRSFATNEYLAGTPSITIMAITGHKTEKAFLSYIKLTPNEHAKILKLHWQKRSMLKSV